MDKIWEARDRRVNEFCNEHNIPEKTCNEIKDIVYDSQYGVVGHIDNFTSVLKDGTILYEWP